MKGRGYGHGGVMTAKKIAVMGGTFDPIHYGHLVAAEAVRYEFAADRVIFVPSGSPPHKRYSRVTDREARYAMTALATQSNPHFTASRMEIDREGATYTIDTIRQLRAEYGLSAGNEPSAEIFFITGADAVQQILTWRDAEELLRLCNFVAVTRPGHSSRMLKKEVERLKADFAGRLFFLEVPALAISSTDIRRRVATGKPITYLLPETVERYIAQERLYQTASCEEIESAVRGMLSDRRYRHTLGVADTARQLAQVWGESAEKAELAGLLHDCAKEIPYDEGIALYKAYGQKPDAVLKKQPELLHSFLSAELARAEFGVNDLDILNAIAYHTTGRKGMSTLEKILFVADQAEPGREPYRGVDEIRALAATDLDRAVVAGLEMKLHYTRKKNKSVHPLGAEALQYYQAMTEATGKRR